MKKRFLALFLVFVLSISLLAGCSSTPAAEPSKNDTPATEQTPSTSTEQTEQTAPAEDVVYKDELHVGYNLEPATLDPMMVADAPVRVVTYGNIYEALVTLDAEFNVKPELCESYEVNNDGREYLYHLRTGIKFHNGEEMTADDVVASMNRWIEHYGNAQNTVGESRFEKVDDSTVKIVFDGPIAFFNELIATQSQGSVIMPKSVIENVDASTGEVQEYIGTGPYKFVEWKSGTYIKLEKFEDYSPYGVEGEASGWYGYKTQATPVIYYDIVSDNATRAAGIQTGEYDIVTEMGGDDFAMLDSIEGLTTYTELNGEYVVVYNKAEGLCADVNMRQAINAILDANEILLGAYNTPDFFREEISFMPAETATWYTDAGKENAHLKDLDLAKEYLEKANYNGETVRILASPSSAALAGGAVVVQSELAAAGINAELITPDYPSYSAYRNDPTKYDLFFASLIPVAVPTLQIYLSSSWAGFTNDQKIFDAVKEMDATADIPTCQKLWEELQTYLWTESLPASKLGSVFIYGVCTDKVENFATFCSAPTVSNIRVRQ